MLQSNGYQADYLTVTQIEAGYLLQYDVFIYAHDSGANSPAFEEAVKTFLGNGGGMVAEWSSSAVLLNETGPNIYYVNGQWGLFEGMADHGRSVARNTPIDILDNEHPIFENVTDGFVGQGATEYFYSSQELDPRLDVVAEYTGHGGTWPAIAIAEKGSLLSYPSDISGSGGVVLIFFDAADDPDINDDMINLWLNCVNYVANPIKISSPLTITNDSTPLLEASFFEKASLTWYVLDGINGTNQTNTTSLKTTLPQLVEGQHNITVYTLDSEGAVEEETLQFLVDLTSPEVNFETNGNSTYLKAQGTIVTATDALSGIQTLEYSWSQDYAEGSVVSWTGFTSGDALTKDSVSGDWYLHVKATDNASNVNYSVSNVFKLDNSVPVIELTENVNSTYSNSHSTTVTVTDTPSGLQSLEYSWSQSNTEGSVDSWTLFNSGDILTKDSVNGDWYLHVKATDNTTNVNYSISNVFKFDNEEPTYEWVKGPTKANTGDNITIELNVLDNIELASCNITADGDEYQMNEDSGSYSYNISIPASDSGTLVSSIIYNCTFSDLAGNTNSTDNVCVDVTILPIADFSANATRGTVPLTVNFTDNSSGLVDNWHWDFGDGNTSEEQSPVHEFGAGNFTVNLTVSNVNGTSTKYLKVRAAEEPVYTLLPEDVMLISVYGEEMNFSVNSTLFSSYEWFINGNTVTGSGFDMFNNTDDSSRISYCNINTSQYIVQDDFFMDVYHVVLNVSNESIGRTDTFSWEWTVTNSSANDGEEVDLVINKTPEVTEDGSGEKHVRFNTTDDENSGDNEIECSISFVSFNTTNETAGVQIKVEVLNVSSLNESAIDFSKDLVYQYLDISFNNETLANEGSGNRSIEFKVRNDLNGGTLVIKTVKLRHLNSSTWESYTPELIDNDGTYSYFIVRNISGFSPFAVTCDYDYPSASTSSSDDGLPAYLKWLMFKEGAEATVDEEYLEVPITSEVNDLSDSQDKVDADFDGSEYSDSTNINSEEGGNFMMVLGVSLIAALAILFVIYRKKQEN
ncbi:PKD domain-containing protein [Methanococcoides orientis]|uniref:PKD domain-containing protein n=1 Tax=Methanococcoides orientis TaxID=2822137 RepID=UPI001E54DEC4|nr:PKD domain-containing protein [Methanococcoides orientis]UGV39705.1 PKD domain-containing protein [Methanococcoides orientis]